MEMTNETNAKDALVKKIVDDAAAKSQGILKDAEDYCRKAIAEAKSAAEEMKAAEASRAKNDADKIIENKQTLSSIETKKATLTYKREIVESVYSRTVELMKKMSKTEYSGLIEALIDKYAEKGDTVILSKNAPLSVDEVKKMKKVSSLSLAVEKTGAFDGGLVLSGAKFDKDLSFTALVEAVKEQTETEVAEKLFA